MTRRPCGHLAADRSALVDDALDPARRDRLLAHLVHCSPCRAEVADLRRMRAALRDQPAAPPPEPLSARLLSIAGSEGQRPQRSRALLHQRPGGGRSRRRLRPLLAAALAVGATVTGVAVIGYTAAPGDGRGLPDPSGEAQSAFSSALAELPLTNVTLGAVVAAGPTPRAGTAGPVAASAETGPGDRALTPRQAHAALARAASAVETVSYRGVQRFRARSDGRSMRADVRVRAVPGRGIRAEVLDRAGQPVGSRFASARTAARMVDDKLMRLLAANYVLGGWAEAEAAGRPATLVEARRGGRLAARWWVDDASGIVLARQTFDRREQPVVSVGFTSIKVEPSASVVADLPEQTPLPVTDTELTLSSAPDLTRQGWVCRSHLAGLSLVRLRSDGAVPQAVHLVYSDGLATVSVVEQHGRLASPPAGSAWDTGLGAYTREGATSVASWQSGTTVFTVVTDGSTELLADAVASLPHDPSPRRTTMERIRQGWAQVLADMKG